MNPLELGEVAGEMCNRNGCHGVIIESEKGACSCPICHWHTPNTPEQSTTLLPDYIANDPDYALIGFLFAIEETLNNASLTMKAQIKQILRHSNTGEWKPLTWVEVGKRFTFLSQDKIPEDEEL